MSFCPFFRFYIWHLMQVINVSEVHRTGGLSTFVWWQKSNTVSLNRTGRQTLVGHGGGSRNERRLGHVLVQVSRNFPILSDTCLLVPKNDFPLLYVIWEKHGVTIQIAQKWYKNNNTINNLENPHGITAPPSPVQVRTQTENKLLHHVCYNIYCTWSFKDFPHIAAV